MTHEETYNFTPGVNAVTGPIGTGKSSMMELIKYVMGGSAKVMPAIRDNVTSLSARIAVDGNVLDLRREMHGRLVDVFDGVTGERLSEWATTNRKHMRKASSEWLRAVGLPSDLRIPRRRTRPNGESVPISFWDVFRYMYLDQNRIDDSVVGHNDSNLDVKRRAVFELMYGLTSPRVMELATERGRLAAEAQTSRAASQSVLRFLKDNELLARETIASRRREVEAGLRDAQRRIDELRQAGRRGGSQGEVLKEVGRLRRSLSELEMEEDEIRVSLDKSRSILAQLELDEHRLARGEAASLSLALLEFVTCPRCMQSLDQVSRPQDHCRLCGQPEPSKVFDPKADLRRIRDQRQETLDLMAEDQAALTAAEAAASEVRRELARALDRVESEAGQPSNPLFDDLAELSRRAALAEAELEQLSAADARWNSYDLLRADADQIDEQIKQLLREEADLRLQLIENEEGLDDLETLFAEIVSGFRVPWLRTASLDRKTYLPVINGESFDNLSVGGARKTLVNLAYHLATLWSTLLRRNEVLMPTFLIVDSPRKNVGEGIDDKQFVDAIYARLERFQLLTNLPEMRGTWQLIIADNDVPSSARRWIPNLIEFTYEAPLVPGVVHPGPDVETLNSTGEHVVELE